MENIKELRIENAQEMEQLTTILTTNGYEVQVKPEYESEEEWKKRTRGRYSVVPIRVVSYIVKIVGITDKPNYGPLD